MSLRSWDAVALMALLFAMSSVSRPMADEIVHDAEFYILKAQNGERWQIRTRSSTR